MYDLLVEVSAADIAWRPHITMCVLVAQLLTQAAASFIMQARLHSSGNHGFMVST